MTSSNMMEPNIAPGTVQLGKKKGNKNELVLHPVPSADPNDPLNWSPWRKTVNFTLACTYVVLAFVQLDNAYVAYVPYERDLGISYDDYNNAIAANYAGLAVGSLFFMPFVHRYGRRPLYLISLLFLLAMSIWAACMRSRLELLPNSLIAGLGGALCETIVAVTIVDIFFVHQHALMNGIFLLSQAVGAFLGPVAMGYAVEGAGWRWMWWITTMLIGANFIIVLFFFEESKFIGRLQGVDSGATANPTTNLMGGDASKTNPDSNSIEPVQSNPTTPYALRSYRQRLALITPTPQPIIHHFYQPFQILFRIPAVAYAALTYGSLLAWMSIMTSAQSYYTALPPYNLDSSKIGLLSLAPFIGLAIGSFIFPPISDWSIIWLSKRNNGVFEPEMRLWLSIPGSAVCLGGILMFGFCLDRGSPLININVGYAIFCVGWVICADVSLTYVLDIYHEILGDSMIAIVFARNAISLIIMFTYTYWVESMGIQNTFLTAAILGFFILLSVPVLLLVWGKRLRISTASIYQHLARFQVHHREL